MTKEKEFELFKTMGSMSSVGFFIYDIKGEKLDYVNPSLTDIFDISHPDFSLQLTFFINHVIPEDLEYLNAEYAKLKQDEKVEDIEFRIRTHDGVIKNIQANCFLIKKKKIIAGFIRDISKVREHETFMVDFGAKKDTLLDMISHNLTAPLNLSQNLISNIEQAIQKRQDVTEHIQVIKNTTNHCIELINDFLEEEHLTSEHIFPKKSRFNVLGKIESILERMRKSYPKKLFIFEPESEALYMVSDEVKFFQIIHNLLSNAVKFTKDKGRIEIIAFEEKRNIKITIKDNGIGIPDEMKEVVFQKYTPAGRPGLKGERSIGMGLFITKQLVTLLGGKIWFESKENKGTQFHIEIGNGDGESNGR